MAMDNNDLSLWLSIIATTISIASFFVSSTFAVWRMWKERARLRFAVVKVIQKTSSQATFNQIEIKVTNIGLRPIILTSFKAISPTSSYSMGDNDPTAAGFGTAIQVFPVKLEAGDTVKFYPMTTEALERNQTNPHNPLQHFDPWLFFAVIDNFGKYHHMYVQDVLRALHMIKKWRPRTKWEEIKNWYLRKKLFSKNSKL